MKIIHLTDSHLVASPQKLFGLDMADRLQSAVDSITKYHSDAEFCVFTGDVTHWGEPEAFEDFRSIMRNLPMPWHPIPGNHDTRDIFKQVLMNTLGDLTEFIQYSVDTPTGRFLLLDTLDEGKASGTLCEGRLNWLEGELEKSRSTDVFLFMHHAPMNVGIAAIDRIKLDNAEKLHRLVKRYPNIRHLFFGHLHRACHGSWHGLPFSTVKATAHQLALVLDSSSPLISSREDPNYAVVMIDRNNVIVHDHSYFDEDKTFTYDRGTPNGDVSPPSHQKNWL